MMNVFAKEPSSFRDESGYVFYNNKNVYRCIKEPYKADYDALIKSGLYTTLKEKHLLVPHIEVEETSQFSIADCYKIIQPQTIPFISYPYEWSFSQLKAAALLTLQIQQLALNHNFVLKDASAFNIQFIGSKPIFIDTLSFEQYKENEPWQAYRQFCTHFLSPLLLFSHTNHDMHRLLSLYPEGIPLDLTSRLLPYKTRFNMPILMHIHWHARAEKKNARKTNVNYDKIKISKQRQLMLIEHLKQTIRKCKLKRSTQWTDYYETCSYNEISFKEKQDFLSTCLSSIKPERVFDAGCNTGAFSEIAAMYSNEVIASDVDSAVVDFVFMKNKKSDTILPLVIDLTNPTPAIGWSNEERSSFVSRLGTENTVLALALIHHLALGNNVPFDKLATFFASISDNLIIEYVDKDDPQSQRLLVTKKDVFTSYTRENFLSSFIIFFDIIESKKLSNDKRELFYMKRKPTC